MSRIYLRYVIGPAMFVTVCACVCNTMHWLSNIRISRVYTATVNLIIIFNALEGDERRRTACAIRKQLLKMTCSGGGSLHTS